MIHCQKDILYAQLKRRFSYLHAIHFLLIAIAFYSCTSLKKIGIEVALQPEYPIAEDIQSLVVLNRSLTNQFTNIEVDTLEKTLIINKMVMDTVFLDSIAADTAIQVAAQALFEAGRFDVVVPKVRNIERTDNADIASPLKIDFVNDLCKDFNVDAALILESFGERLNTKYYLSISEGTGNEIKEYSAATDISYFTEWRLYKPNNLKPVVRFHVGDSIFWKAASLSLEDLYSKMPRTKSALIGGGIAAGLKMAGYISPKWISQTRYYFLTGKKEIDAAVPLIKDNKWEEAAVIWNKYASVASKATKSKVEYNLALAAEMIGDLDLAIEWGLKSYKTKYTKAAEVFLKTLDNKLKAQQKQNIQ